MPLVDGGISGNGTIVVGGAFRWVVGSAAPTALTGVPAGFIAQDISADGTVVVGGRTRWTAAAGAQVLTLPSVEYSASAMATSANGGVTVGDGNDGGVDVAFLWAPLNWIRVPGTYDETFASGVSDDGAVGVGRGRVIGATDSALWFTSTTSNVLTGGGNPRVISGNGAVIAGFASTSAVKWSGAGYTTRQVLPGLPSTQATSIPYAANTDGSVIVGYSRTSATTLEAVLWTSAGNIQRIADILAATGTSLTGWALEIASDVSADGKVVIGSGRLNGVAKSWIARLP
jgi:uncharacterized membrane protein